MKSRRLTSGVMSILIVFSAFAVLNITSINARAAYDETILWPDGKTIENQTLTYPSTGKNSALIRMYKDTTGGDLIIKNNGTLIFNDNVTFQIENPASPNDHDYGITIEAGGEFIIASSLGNVTIKSDPANPTRTYPFLNSGTIDFL